MRKRRLKSMPFKLPETDTAEFQQLYRIMYAVFGSQRQAAIAMGISYPTYLRWEKQPPTWPYYNYVMLEIIKARLRGLRINRASFTKTQWHRYREEIHKLTAHTDIMEQIEADASEIHAAIDHVRSKLSRGGMYTDELYKAAHTGGYSRAVLRRAANSIGVVKKTYGFGENRRTHWRLPRLEDE